MSRSAPAWQGSHYAFFSNRQCEFYPCHPGADPENFNCLFCYCPLYALGAACGGSFTLLANGVKDCSRCLTPHLRESYGRITGRYAEIAALIQSDGHSGPAGPSGQAAACPPGEPKSPEGPQDPPNLPASARK